MRSGACCSGAATAVAGTISTSMAGGLLGALWRGSLVFMFPRRNLWRLAEGREAVPRPAHALA